ncbi:PrsW family glutamic-type intramembrane protease [Trichormus azollae]|uniref:PrsW family glutamic-type intramembrane protease n=1 Tax=Trichormus azollae TaxID=1164 RepID=UPI003B837C32
MGFTLARNTAFFLRAVLRQILVIAPIEEGCKFIRVIIPLFLFIERRYKFRPTKVFPFTIAVTLGFRAEENWIYFTIKHYL